MQEATNTETKILRAAMEVFIQKGRHGAKMQEIADSAGINKAMLHYYFRSKENLYIMIFKTVFIGFFSEIEKVFQEGIPFEQQLSAIINRYVDILNANERIPLFLAREFGEGGEIVKRIVSEIMEQQQFQLPRFLFRLMENAKKKGEMRDVDSKQFILTLLGSSVFFFIAEPVVFTILQKFDPLDRKTFIEERKKAIFEVLYYGIKPREPFPQE